MTGEEGFAALKIKGKPPLKPFLKGNPGGPGRPKGSRPKATVAAENLMLQALDSVILAVVKKAQEGDIPASRIIIDRLVPVRATKIEFPLPPTKTAADVAVALGMVTQAVGTGELAPDDALKVASILETQRKAIETVELEARIAEIEKRFPR
jgi:hypothetical protein